MDASPSSLRMSCLLVVLLLLAGAPFVPAVAANPQASTYVPFVAGNVGREYRPLDPLTLADTADPKPLAFDRHWPHLAVSGDGSTFVVIDPSQGPLVARISVRDGVYGRERLTITTDQSLFRCMSWRRAASTSRRGWRAGCCC